MFESAAPQNVALRLVGYVVIGALVGCLIVYSPAVEFVPAWIMEAVGLVYFGSLGLALLIGLPVAIVIGIVRSIADRRRTASVAEQGE